MHTCTYSTDCVFRKLECDGHDCTSGKPTGNVHVLSAEADYLHEQEEREERNYFPVIQQWSLIQSSGISLIPRLPSHLHAPLHTVALRVELYTCTCTCMDIQATKCYTLLHKAISSLNVHMPSSTLANSITLGV